MKTLFLYLQRWFAVKLLNYRNQPMDFVIYPDKRLTTPCKEVDFSNTTYEERSEMVRKMGNALSSASYGGKLGLAANQIGIDAKIAIVQGVVVFNPTWEGVKQQTEESLEGCYSVPGKTFRLNRAKYGWATWRDINNIEHKRRVKGLSAIVFQHEIDHLNGICCADAGVEVPHRRG